MSKRNAFTDTPDQKQPDYLAVSGELLSFIKKCPTPFHTAAVLKEELEKAGFIYLPETEAWSVMPGSRCFTIRGGTSLIAFQVPEDQPRHFQITAAHSDSPTFRLKHHPYLPAAGHYVQLNVEKYGGAILSPWLDRPLSIAGRVVVRSASSGEEVYCLKTRLVNLDRDLVLIPNLAIHMNRRVNEGYEYHVQKDLLPLLGDETSEGKLEEMIARELDIEKEQILSSDLFLYNRTPGSLWGAGMEYVSSPKLDDLQCVFAGLKAFLAGGHTGTVSVFAVFDNEEVGSLTKQGADSTFLSDSLERLWQALKQRPEEYPEAVAGSFLISADNAHALHPQHQDKSDPVHRPFMNHGPVIKYHAGQKYTSDAVSGAAFEMLCEKAGVPWQVFHNHSDQPGGSTLGNLSNAHVSLNAVDIGLAQLAMHSPYETAGTRDTLYLIRALGTFWQSDLQIEEGGVRLS